MKSKVPPGFQGPTPSSLRPGDKKRNNTSCVSSEGLGSHFVETGLEKNPFCKIRPATHQAGLHEHRSTEIESRQPAREFFPQRSYLHEMLCIRDNLSEQTEKNKDLPALSFRNLAKALTSSRLARTRFTTSTRDKCIQYQDLAMQPFVQATTCSLTTKRYGPKRLLRE